jgi:group II intron reverse transcriptase/maturase
MRKLSAGNGVGQLVLQIVFPDEQTSNAAEETQEDGPQASSASAPLGEKTKLKHKWYSLYDKVFALPNLERAWQSVQANAGAGGIDHMTIARFGEDAPTRLQHLCDDLRAKTYRPQPVRRGYIAKSGGGKRPLGIPTLRDRIVQQALRQVLEPIFEAKFSTRSHGFRPQRGSATALGVVDRAVRHGYEWVVDADIASFFDTVDPRKLLGALNEEVSDGSVLNLIGAILKAGVVQPGASEIEPTERGTPQGGPLSPLLANVYLHAFDVQMSAAGYGLVRYADDFVVFVKSEAAAHEALTLAKSILEGEWGLRLHPEKTRVVSMAEGFEFLGFRYESDPKSGGVVKEVRAKSACHFRETIRSHTPRLKNQRRVKARHCTLIRLKKNKRVGARIGSLNRHLVGWHGYFRQVWSRYPQTPFRNFDGYVRQRVRTAITGRVGPGWWNARLSKQVLSSLGLLSLDDLQRKYRKDHGLVPARKG